jgi:hypothetical protein
VRVPRQAESLGRDASCLELVDLLEQDAGIDDAPGPDDADRAGIEDSGGDVAEGEALAVADDRVAGVRTALVAAHDVGPLREEVDNLSLAFVAPLRAHDHSRRHGRKGSRAFGAR